MSCEHPKTTTAWNHGGNPTDEDYGDTVGWLCNSFLHLKELKRLRGDLTQRAFNDYRASCERFAAFMGEDRRLGTIKPNDLERYRNSLPETWSPTTVNNHLRYVRALLSYANELDAFFDAAMRLRKSYGIDPDDDVTGGRPRQLTTDGKCNHADTLPEISVQLLYDRADKTRPLPYMSCERHVVCEIIRQRCQKCQRLLPTWTLIDTGKVVFTLPEPPTRVFARATKPA